jgi:hypothetical protein
MPRGRAQGRRRAGTEFSRSSANESGTSSATGSGGWIQPGRPDADSVAARATGSGAGFSRGGRARIRSLTGLSGCRRGRASAGRQRGSAGGSAGRPDSSARNPAGSATRSVAGGSCWLPPGGRRAASAAGRRDWLAAIAELRLPGLVTSAASISVITAASQGYGK